MDIERGDILLPLSPPEAVAWSPWLLLTLATVLGAWLAWRSRGRMQWPLRRLRRGLRRRHIAPRQGAHALAALLRRHPRPAAPLLRRLDAIRFCREPPSPEQVLTLVDQALRGLGERPHDG